MKPMNVYSLNVVHTALAAAKNLIVLTPAVQKVIRILEAEWSTDGNDLNQQLRASIYRVTVAGTGAPTAVVAQPLVVGAGLTATTICGHTYATTEPTLHTVSIWQLGFPSLTGALYLPKKEKEIIRVLGTTPIAFRIDTTTFTACNVLLRVRFEEES